MVSSMTFSQNNRIKIFLWFLFCISFVVNKVSRRRMFPVALLLSCILCSPLVIAATDIIVPDEVLSGNRTLTSQGGVFEMGFFTPGTSGKYYIGIWYKGLPSMTVVWVANRQQPVFDPFLSQFKILRGGSLLILDSSNNIVWSTDSTRQESNYTHGVLLDDGNFVISGNISNNLSDVVWQSFDHPTDTWLPGAKFGYTKRTNDTAKLVAWRHPDDPAPGPFSLVYGCNDQFLYELRNDSKVYWDSREWTRATFKNESFSSIVIEFSIVSNDIECYAQYSIDAPFNITRERIDSTGKLQTLVWLKGIKSWRSLWQQPAPECEIVAFCGLLGSCNRSNYIPICGSHSQVPFCSGKIDDSFLVMSRVRFIPQYYDYFLAESIDLCRTLCLSKCSCAAFAYDEVCFLWTLEKFKVQLLGDDDILSKAIYIRTSNSLPKAIKNTTRRNDSKFIALGCSLLGFAVLGLMVTVILRRRYITVSTSIMADDNSLIVFKYHHLSKYTKKFTTKIGEGGFGCVFKGNVSESNVIAVKRLKDVNQTEKQFLAEVKTIGSIHHVNLVRLCGFCINGSSRFLVYNYMPNGSLASHLFPNGFVSWEARYKIAIGIAKGLAYLHDECRDCIIHCDIKPENVLLDSDMAPKIADFGLAKLVGRNFSRVLTTIRGTRGYLAPEWISGEAITSKVDVFSYGKLLFEIISGKRNVDMPSDDILCYFPIRVFDKIRKGGEDLLTLLDYEMENVAELERACRVACWCIQDNETTRPTMSQVVQMLEGLTEVPTNPPVPRFFQQLLMYS